MKKVLRKDSYMEKSGEEKIRHLEMIQGVINRMANNSFMLKGWAVTLITGIFILSDIEADKLFFMVAYLPVVVFWLLDSYYLCQERSFRKLYNSVCEKENNNIDFLINPSKCNFKEYLKCVTSFTELCFYMPLALVCAIIMIIVLI